MTKYSNRDLSRDVLTESLFADQFFSTGELFDGGVAQGNTKKLLVSNPAESGKALLISSPAVRSTGEVQVGKSKNVTIDTEGDGPTTGIVGKATQSDSPVASAQIGGDNETGAFSGGTDYSSKTSGGGANGASQQPGSSGEVGVTNVVYPGDNLLVSATAIGGERKISIDMDFAEYPVEEVD